MIPIDLSGKVALVTGVANDLSFAFQRCDDVRILDWQHLDQRVLLVVSAGSGSRSKRLAQRIIRRLLGEERLRHGPLAGQDDQCAAPISDVFLQPESFRLAELLRHHVAEDDAVVIEQWVVVLLRDRNRRQGEKRRLQLLQLLFGHFAKARLLEDERMTVRDLCDMRCVLEEALSAYAPAFEEAARVLSMSDQANPLPEEARGAAVAHEAGSTLVTLDNEHLMRLVNLMTVCTPAVALAALTPPPQSPV